MDANNLVSHVVDEEIMSDGIADYMISKENQSMTELNEVIDCIADDIKTLQNDKAIALNYQGELCYLKGREMVDAARNGIDTLTVYGENNVIKGTIIYEDAMEQIGEAHMNAIIYAETLRWMAYSKYSDSKAAYADLKSRVEMQTGELTDSGRSFLAQCSTIACDTHMSFKMKCMQLLELIGYNTDDETIDFAHSDLNEYGVVTPLGAYFVLAYRAGSDIFSMLWDGLINVLHGLRYVIDKALGGLITEFNKGLLTFLGFTDAYAQVDDYIDETFSDFHCDFKLSASIGLPNINECQTLYPTWENVISALYNYYFDDDPSGEVLYDLLTISEELYGQDYTKTRNITQVALGILHYYDPREILVRVDESEEHEGHIFYHYDNRYNLTIYDILCYIWVTAVDGQKIWYDANVIREHLSTTHYTKVALPCGILYLFRDSSDNICCSIYTIPTTIEPITTDLKDVNTWTPYLDQFLVQGHGNFDLSDGDCLKYLGYGWMWNCLYLSAMNAADSYSDSDVRLDASTIFNFFHTGYSGVHTRYISGWQNTSLVITMYKANGEVAVQNIYESGAMLDITVTPLDIAWMLAGRLDGGYWTFDDSSISELLNAAKWVLPCIANYFSLMFDDNYFYPYVQTSSLPYGKYKVLNMRDQIKQTMVIPVVIAVTVIAIKVFKKIKAIKASLWKRQAVLDTALFNATDGSKEPINYDTIEDLYKEQKRINLISVLLGAFIGSVKTAITFVPKLISNATTSAVNGLRNIIHGQNADSTVVLDDITNLDESERLALIIRLIRGY